MLFVEKKRSIFYLSCGEESELPKNDIQKQGRILMLPVDAIEPSPYQARTAFDEPEIAALAVSILQNGLLQPISVRRVGLRKYQLVAGERRLRACPPFSDLFTITVAGLEERGLIEASVRLRDALAANLRQEPYRNEPVQLLGPAPASVARVNYSYRYQLTLVCKNSAQIRRLLSFLLTEFSKDRRNKGITAFIDVNSYQ